VDDHIPDGPFELVVIVTAAIERAQCYATTLAPTINCIEVVRDKWPTAWVVVAGPHGTELPDATASETKCDVLVQGEVCGAILAAGRRRMTQPTGEAGANRRDLDSDQWSAAPALDLVPIERYRAEILKDGRLAGGNTGLVLGMSGCPHGCSYCYRPNGRRLARRTIASLDCEIAAYERLGIHDLFVLDYVFGLDNRFYDEFRAQLTSHSAKWLAQTRIDVVLSNDMQDWARSGCWGLWLGVEDLAVAHRVGKATLRQDVERAVDSIRKAGVLPLIYVMVGLPGQDEKCIAELGAWLTSVDLPFLASRLTLRPGTALFDAEVERMGLRSPLPSWSDVRRVNETYLEGVPFDVSAAVSWLDSLNGNVLSMSEWKA
jgi:radical SAM superfamily enzyme YgiQ (UPF0313 family)